MLRKLFAATFFSGMLLFLFASEGSAASKTIFKPMFNGNRLDWCMKWSEDCGRPAADAYCRAQGFVRATWFQPEKHIGARSPTRLIGTGATCDLAHCDGFRQITCLKQTIVAAPRAKSEGARAGVTPSLLIKRYAGTRLASAGGRDDAAHSHHHADAAAITRTNGRRHFSRP